MLEHQVSQIVRGQSIIGLNLQRLFIQIFGLFPLIARFQQATQRDVDSDIARIGLQSAVVAGDRLVHGSTRNLYARKQQECIDVVPVKIRSFLEGLLGFGGILATQLDLTEQHIEAAAIGDFRNLILHDSQGIRQLFLYDINIYQAGERVEGGGASLQRIE